VHGFLLFAILFLAGAIYNLFKGDYPNMAAGVVASILLFTIFLTRKSKAHEEATIIAHQDPTSLRCCKCGRAQNVERRAYLVTYSLFYYTSKSPGTFRPICDRCSIKAGLPYSLLTALVGWWGFPSGPIQTVQAIRQNFKGGIVLADLD
jgi:hypothetical protein